MGILRLKMILSPLARVRGVAYALSSSGKGDRHLHNPTGRIATAHHQAVRRALIAPLLYRGNARAGPRIVYPITAKVSPLGERAARAALAVPVLPKLFLF